MANPKSEKKLARSSIEMNGNPAWNDDQMSFFEVDLSLSAQTFSLIQSSTTCGVSAICLQLDTETGNLKKIIQAFSKKSKTERRLHLINHFGSPKGTYYKPKFYFSQVEENFMAVKHCQTCLTVYGSFGFEQ